MNRKKRKIEFAAQVTNAFRGVPVIIFGILACIFAIINYATELDTQSRNGYGRDLTYLGVFLLFVIVYAVFGYPRIRDYYRRKYGRTKEKSGNLTTFLESSLVLLPLLFSCFVAGDIDAEYQFSFSVTALSSALFVLIIWWAKYRGISNMMLVLSGLLAISAFLPWEQIFLSVTNSQRYSARHAFYENIMFLIYGIACMVSGLTEYLFMIKMLKPIEREEEIYESV